MRCKQKMLKSLSRRQILKYGLYGGLTATFAPSIWLTGCERRPLGEKTNVILIVVDTLRADRLGCHGNPSGITPEIDKFARNAVRFEKAFSHAPWTLPSVASLFTSRYPAQHAAGGRLGSFKVLHDDAVTIAELFRRAGFATAAIINVFFLTKKFGMTRGFSTVDATEPKENILLRRADSTTEVALRWLNKNRRKPFFLFVHYFDPHLTYDPPQPFRRRFAHTRDAERSDYLFGSGSDIRMLRRGLIEMTPNAISRLEKLYNGEVAYVDYQVGKFLAAISERGLDDNTIIILTSDHGEEFGDHDGFEHGHTLYDELLHVPLIIRVPGLTDPQIDTVAASGKGISVRTTVRQIDIAPTLCELTGIEPESAFVGKSLVSLLKGNEEPDRPVLSQGNMWGRGGVSWRKDGYKLIREPRDVVNQGSLGGPAGGRKDRFKVVGSLFTAASFQLFDINADPRERYNLAYKMPQLCAEKARDLNLVLRTISTSRVAGRAPKLSKDEVQRLRSLGYME